MPLTCGCSNRVVVEEVPVPVPPPVPPPLLGGGGVPPPPVPPPLLDGGGVPLDMLPEPPGELDPPQPAVSSVSSDRAKMAVLRPQLSRTRSCCIRLPPLSIPALRYSASLSKQKP